MRSLLATLIFPICWAPSLLGADLSVPTDYPTIQAALAAASAGDDIIVEPGVYNETFVIFKSGITVRSKFPRQAILDGSGLADPLIKISLNPSKLRAEVRGFEIRDSNVAPAVYAGSVLGGENKGLRLIDCWVHDNQGGAAFIDQSYLKAQDCDFESNQSTTSGVVEGIDSTILLKECTFTENAGTDAGALYLESCDVDIESCTFEQNTATGSNIYLGGGAMRLKDCLGAEIINSLIFRNLTQGSGAGIHADGLTNVDIIGCTITDNGQQWAPEGSGLYIHPIAIANLYGSIIMENDGGQDIVADGDLNVQYSAVPSQYSGVGNVHDSPSFVNPSLNNYRLRLTSPCVDAGNNFDFPRGVDFDLDGNARFVDDPEVTDTGNGSSPVIDMGCYERVPYVYAIRYVDGGAPSGGNGLTWATAFSSLADALEATPSSNVGELWVAEGIYYPIEGVNDRSFSFRIFKGVELYGGFAGHETRREERDWRANRTVLSGNIGTRLNFDNSYNVVIFRGNDSRTVLDGFTVEGGMANGPSDEEQRGAGIYIEPALANANDHPIVRNCVIEDNVSDLGGAGAYVDDRRAMFIDCRFSNNTSQGNGGGLLCRGSLGHTSLLGCVLNDNLGTEGAGLSSTYTEIAIVNSTFHRNTSTSGFGGGILCRFESLTIANSILWENEATSGNVQEEQLYVSGFGSSLTIDHCCVEGWNGSYGGVGNMGQDPQFVDPVGEWVFDTDLRLCTSSPCIDAGDDAFVPAELDQDLWGQQRFVDAVDIGGFESSGHELFQWTRDSSVGPGHTLTLNSCGGLPGSSMIQCVTAVNGSLFFLIVLAHSFDSNGESSFSATVPPGLSGVTATFQTIGFNAGGTFGESVPVDIYFE